MTTVKTVSDTMISGRLRHEIIEVVTPKIIIDEYGSQTTVYEHKFTTRAEMVRNSGNREITNNEVFYGERKQFSIRIYHNIEDFDIVLWNRKRYRILDIERNKEQQRIIVTTELVNE